MKTTLQRWGNSQGVRIPKAMIESLGMRIGTPLTIELSEDQSRITIAPELDRRPVRGRYRIEDLITASSLDASTGKEEWIDACGKEVW